VPLGHNNTQTTHPHIILTLPEKDTVVRMISGDTFGMVLLGFGLLVLELVLGLRLMLGLLVLPVVLRF